MLPLPHDGVCTACGLEGCSHLISRTPECLRCARLLLKRIHVFLSKERRRASPSPTAPFSFISLSASGELSGLQGKSSSGASRASPPSLANRQHGVRSGWRPRHCLATRAQLSPFCLDSTLAWRDPVSVPQRSTSKPDSGDQNTNKRQRTTGTLRN